MKTALIVGGASFDSIIYVEKFLQPIPQTIFSKEFRENIGSTGAGKALNLSSLGFATTLHALIGEDVYGEKIKQYLKKDNLNFIYDIDSKGTERHINLMDDNGDRISIFVTWADFNPRVDEQRLKVLIKSSDYIIINIINYARRFIPVAKELGKPIWCDLHDYDGKSEYHLDFVDGADYVFLSSDNMPVYRPFMEKLIHEGKNLVVCTHGKDGATALTKEGVWIGVPAIEEYKRVDTNGAGDSFFSGFLYGFSKNYSVEKCLRFGAIAGGLCITSYELAYPELCESVIEDEYKRHYEV